MSEYIALIIPKKRAPRRHSAIYCADLPSSVRLCFGQPCSPFEAGALPVLRPARRIHIRLRGRVLCNPPRLKGFRPAVGGEASRAVHPRELGKRRMRSSLPSGKSAAPPARCIQHPQRDTSSAGYRLLVSRASAGASRELSSRRSPALAPHTCAVSPTFLYGAFFFVTSALAAVPPARLASCRRKHTFVETRSITTNTIISQLFGLTTDTP